MDSGPWVPASWAVLEVMMRERKAQKWQEVQLRYRKLARALATEKESRRRDRKPVSQACARESCPQLAGLVSQWESSRARDWKQVSP